MDQYHPSITTQTASITGYLCWVGFLSVIGRESSATPTSRCVLVVMTQVTTVVLKFAMRQSLVDHATFMQWTCALYAMDTRHLCNGHALFIQWTHDIYATVNSEAQP